MKYGLIGEHLAHSFSKEIHELCADYTYEICELAPEAVPGFMQNPTFTAINVTIPYKQTVMPYLYEIHEHAKAIGAVNSVVNRDGKLWGYNTDFYGLSALIRRVCGSLKGEKVLILGSGGTSHTARAVVKAEGAASVLTVVRNPSAEGQISYAEAEANHGDTDVIINCTPCGMYPYADGASHIKGTPIDILKFSRLSGVVDAVYNPLRTNLVQDALDHGIPAEGGLYMLVAQAVMASRIFLGRVEEAFSDETAMDEETDRVYRRILASKENIVLTGMPSSGKSTVGKALAQELGRPFVDTDAVILQRAGKPITEIFSELGEVGFRDLETQVVKDVANTHTGAVIATGGGAILRDENIRALRRTGRIYFLNRPLEYLIPTADRPIASTVEDIRRRFEERYDRYLATCDVEIKTDEVMKHTLNTIREDFFS
ncbi:MAG: shikimate dehydrogenase [Ruminococcaceae bacterium]|nr:shikimate dehydrogenase [Oscillospiraceae bacterium]